MPQNQSPQSLRLESWKEIAEHIGRDVRTAMRWAEHGMPVHRIPGGTRGHVFAFAEEIDAWLLSAGTQHQVSGARGQGAENREQGTGCRDSGLGRKGRNPNPESRNPKPERRVCATRLVTGHFSRAGDGNLVGWRWLWQLSG